MVKSNQTYSSIVQLSESLDFNKEQEISQPKFCSRTTCLQIKYAFIINMTSFGIGLCLGFNNTLMTQYSKDFSGSVKDNSWIVLVINLAAPIGCLPSGVVMDYFGRKTALIVAEVPFILGWGLIGFSNIYIQLLIGRIFCGLGIGMALILPRAYTSEIAEPNMRGPLTAFANFGISFGFAGMATMGNFLNWRLLASMGCAYSCLILILNSFVPETPPYLILKGNITKALFNLRKVRGRHYNSKMEMDIMVTWYRSRTNLVARYVNCTELCRSLRAPNSYKPFFIIFIYALIVQCTGATINWYADILQQSKSSVPEEISYLCIYLSDNFGVFVSAILLYFLGRRTLSIISASGVGISAISFGLYVTFSTGKYIYPIIMLTVYHVFGNLALYELPLLMASEMYPLQVRGILGGMTVSIINLMTFVLNKYYPTIRDILGFGNLYIFFGSAACLGILYFIYALPEVKNMTLPEIEHHFAKTSSKRQPSFEDTINLRKDSDGRNKRLFQDSSRASVPRISIDQRLSLNKQILEIKNKRASRLVPHEQESKENEEGLPSTSNEKNDSKKDSK